MFIEICLFSFVLYEGSVIIEKLREKLKEKTESDAADTPDAKKDAEKLPSLSELETTYQLFIKNKVDPIFGNTRDRQLKSLSSAQNLSEQEKKLNRHLGVACANMGLALVAQIFYPPLLLATLPGIACYLIDRYNDAYQSLVRKRRVGIAALDSVGVTWMVLAGYFFVNPMTIFLAMISRKLLLQTKDCSQKKLIDVFSRHSGSVWVLKDGTETEIPFEQLGPGDIAVVNAGEIIPADGTVEKGTGFVGQQALTGESVPAEKRTGDQVFATTLLLSGSIHIRVEKSGQETAAAKIGEILNRTIAHKTVSESKAEKIVDQFVPPTLGLSGLAYLLVGTRGAVAILFDCIGANMRVIGPLSTLNFLNTASRGGILVKDGHALEKLTEADAYVFDKTGTLTLDQPFVKKIHSLNGLSEDRVLTYAAAAEHRQTHPVAKAILSAARSRNLSLPDPGDRFYEIGYGIRVSLGDQIIRVGSRHFMEAEDIPVPDEIKALERECGARGCSLVMLSADKELAGAIELHPTTRPEAKQVIRRLRQQNIKTYIISGDREAPTRALAQELEIDEWFAETLPGQKSEIVEQLQREGKTVCFVGDGINDSVALKKADVSVSLRGASTAAIDAAQIVLMDENLGGLIRISDMSRKFDKNQKTNLIISLVPNIICTGGVFLLHFGIYAAMIFYYSGLTLGIANSIRSLPEEDLIITDSGMERKNDIG
ncbi:heavy metal translocating P-type ATPase [Desulfonema magnum]|uniref:Heavy metal translocating P-type ATPase n=1 Tax=Desulfonema magnum TaxID=45655 RepID=A0A975BJI1_9BACT|nr:heavy metal translocating P-type ATPase [Desulfonema magnum]QTA86304.1 Heavy metal translocating P-type ATPase [Desulfonema magnum]